MPTSIESLRAKHLEEIDAKLEKLRPAYTEYTELMAYRDSLGGSNGGRTVTATAPSSGPKRRSPSGSGPRAGVNRPQQFLEVVKTNPGLTIPDIAKKMGVSPNYLYRVRTDLENEKKIRREDKKLYAVESA